MNADQIGSLQPELAALLGRFRDCFQLYGLIVARNPQAGELKYFDRAMRIPSTPQRDLLRQPPEKSQPDRKYLIALSY